MPGPSRSSSPNRSWRAGPRPAGRQSSARQVSRVLFSLLGLALTGLLGFLLWWWIFLPDIHLACLPVVDYDVLAVPPAPFAADEVTALSAAWPHRPATILRDLQTSDGMRTLANRLQGIVARPKDTLILYLIGHGVSEDGTAALLCSDFLRQGEAGRCGVREVLQQVRQCPAALKLLVLDTGHLSGDPRLGMVANEFPRLLDAEARQAGDPGLWILTAASPLEISHSAYAARRTVFGHFVTEGLCGVADQNHDGRVDLDELVRYVRASLADWMAHAQSGQETQTPLVFHGGQGMVDVPPPGIALVPAARHAAPPEPAGESPDAAAPAKPSQAVPAARTLLAEAWALRDQAIDRQGKAAWTPIDYAPHLWREYEALVVGYELRYRYGAVADAAKVADDLRANVLPLKDLLARGTLPAGVAPSTVLARLAEARRLFLGSEAATAFEQGPEPLVRLKQAIQLKNDLVFRAADYVRWHGRACRSSAVPLRLQPPLAALLDQLAELAGQLDAFENAGRTAVSRQEMLSQLEALRARMATIQRLHANLDSEGLLKLAADLTKPSRESADTAGMEALLATACLPSQPRLTLLDALAVVKQPPLATDWPVAPGPAAPRPISEWQWDRLAEQSGLESQLVRLAEPASAPAPPGVMAGRSDAEHWDAYRGFGKNLAAFYRRLPAEIERRLASAPAQGASAERLLRAVAARDARSVTAQAGQIAVRAIRFLPPPERRLEVTGPKELVTLDPDRPRPLQLTVRATGLPTDDLRLMLKYDPAELAIQNADGQRPWAPDEWAPIALTSQRDGATVGCLVAGKVLTGTKSPLTVVARAGEETSSCKIEFQLPTRDVVELLIDGIPGTVEQRPDVLRLRTFPNRVTGFRFALVNRSGRAREVTAQLLAVPEMPPPRRVVREDLLDPAGNARDGIQELSPAIRVALPADAAPRAIELPEPKPPAPEAKAPAADPSAKPAAPVPPPKPRVTRGLACVIRDAATQEPKWIRWIEFAPLAPWEYLEDQVSYRLSQRKISVQLQARDPKALPPLSEKHPIAIQWHTEDSAGLEATRKDQADLVAADGVARLFALVAPTTEKDILVRLSIDGYPRAMVYRVPCDRDQESVRRERALTAIRITSPEPDFAYRVPQEGPTPPLAVEFQVDAPEDAFQQPGDAVEVGIDENGDRELSPEESRRFLTDRQVEVLLDEIGPHGKVAVSTTLGDFRVMLDPGGLKNTKVNLIARLLLARGGPDRGRVAAVSIVPVVLDGKAPVFRMLAPGRPIPRGEELKVSVQVEEELSGVKEVQFGFDLDKSGKLEEAEKPKVVRRPDDDGQWTAALPTKDLDPGRYDLLAQVTDRVGYSSTRSQVVTIAPPPSEKPAKTTSTIAGRVLLKDGRALPNIEVRIHGVGQAVTTDANGAFTFRDLPAGKYVLHAKGPALGREVHGSTEITLPAPTDPAAVEMRLEW